MRHSIAAFIIGAVTLTSQQASSATAALVCLFKPSGERFNLVAMNGKNYIQWGSGEFEGIVAEFKEPYLTVIQYGYKGTFRMVYDAPKGIGYGGVVGFDGKEIEGEILCAKQ